MTSPEPENRSLESLLNNSAVEDAALRDVSDATLVTIEMICFLCVFLPACLIGVPANMINCMVFWRQGLQDGMNLCLFSLALADFMYLTSTLAIYPCSSLISLFDKQLGNRYFAESMAVLLGPLNGFRAASGFIGVMIAVERCVCIVLPLRSSILVQTKTVGIVIIVSFVIFQVTYLPYSFSLEGTSTSSNSGELWKTTPSQFFKDNYFILEIVLGNFLDLGIPFTFFLILIVVTTVTVVKLKEAMAWRQSATRLTSGNDGQQAALTLMLVAVSVVHIVTMLPYVACQIAYITLQDPLGTSYGTFLLLKNISHYFAAVNSAFHLFIYHSRSSRFRQTIRSMFGQTRN